MVTNKTKSSLLGNIFEAGFKLGFLRFCIKKRKPFDANDVLENLIGKILSYKEEFGILGDIFSKEDINIFEYIPEPKAKSYEESLIYKVENLFQRAIKKDEVDQLSAYVIGVWHGYLFCREIFKKNVKSLDLIYFDLKSESYTKGSSQNADINFIITDDEDNYHLHLYDLKFNFGRFYIEKLNTKYEQKEDSILLPPKAWGYPLSLSLGNTDFMTFLKSFYNLIETNKDDILFNIDFDLKTTLQVFSYLLDYLGYCNDDNFFKKLKTVKVGYISGIVDGVVYSLDVQNNIDINQIKSLASAFKSFYQDAEQKIAFSKDLEAKVLKDPLTFNAKLNDEIKKLEKLIEEKRRQINDRKGNQEVIPIDLPIKDVRLRVSDIVKNFWNSSDEAKALILLHSTGSGKTTSTRNHILNQSDTPVVYLYFAPRRSLINQEIEEIRKIENVHIINPYELKKNHKAKNSKRSSSIGVEGASQHNIEYDKSGLLKLISEEIEQYLNSKDNTKSIAAFATTQSITSVRTAREPIRTFGYIEDIVIRIKIRNYNYKCVIVIDELTGSDNGFYALKEALDLMSAHPEVCKVLAFDATMHSGSSFESAFKEFLSNNYISPSLSIIDFQKDKVIDYGGKIKLDIRSDYSYPAKNIIITEEFFFDNSKPGVANKDSDRVYIEIADYLYNTHLKAMKEKNERMFIYIQNKEVVEKIRSYLETRHGINCEYYTSSTNSGKEKILQDNPDFQVVISTSTLSRGINLYQNFTKVVIINTHYFSPESNLAEEIQACARIRGMKDEQGNLIDDKVDKEIIKIYVIKEELNSEEDLDLWALEHKNAIQENLERQGHTLIDVSAQKLKELIKKESIFNSLKTAYVYANISKLIIKSYFNPYGLKKVVIPIPNQLSPIYIPSQENFVSNFISFLKDIVLTVKDETERGTLHLLINTLQNLLDISSIKDFKIDNIIKFHPPYALIENNIISETNKEARENLKKILSQGAVLNIIRNTNPDKVEDLLELNKIVDLSKIQFPSIIYIPIISMLYEIADKSYRSINIKLRNYLTRANIKLAFENILKDEEFILERVGDEAIKAISFPVKMQESFGWINGDYPKVSGELFEKIIDLS